MSSPAAKPRRLGLTKSGYNGASLHGKALERSDTQIPPDSSDDFDDIAARIPSPDISAPPLSSSDEESSPKRKLKDALGDAEKEDATRLSKKQAVAGKVVQGMSPYSKRSSRSVKRGSTVVGTGSNPPDSLDAHEEEFFTLSQQSQRRKARGYGRANGINSNPSTNIHDSQGDHSNGFKAPRDLEHDAKHKDLGEAFKVPLDLELSINTAQEQSMRPRSYKSGNSTNQKGFLQRATKISDPLLRTEVQEAIDASNGGFRMREDPLDLIPEPSSSLEALRDTVFSRNSTRHSRSSSVSSLSPVPSSASLREAGEDSVVLSKCPLCGVHVSRAFFESYNNGRPLKFSDQHRFCHAHQLDTAKEEWKERGYPAIDWVDWTSVRVKRSHMSILLQILYSKRDSHYESILAEKAAGGLKTLQSYFKRDIIDSVSTGYYGPKGNKLMSGAIQSRLSQQLHQSAKKKPLVRDAGVGGYVQAVLVPELTVLLVKEDMKLTDDERARCVMKESTGLGDLLQGEEEDDILDGHDDGMEDGMV